MVAGCDVKVDVTEDRITIQGERQREHEEERGGVYRSGEDVPRSVRTKRRTLAYRAVKP